MATDPSQWNPPFAHIADIEKHARALISEGIKLMKGQNLPIPCEKKPTDHATDYDPYLWHAQNKAP